MLMLNSPSNPTGVVMSEAEVQPAVAIARKHDLLIMSDEIYEPFLYDMPRGGCPARRSITTRRSSSAASPRATR